MNNEKVKIEKEFDAIVIHEGQNSKLRIVNEEWYQSELSKFKHEERVKFKIEKEEKKRTKKQNRYYWGVYLPKIIEETGEPDKDRLHELFKGKFLTIGIFEVLGEKVRIKKSTTELSSEEFSKYIRNIESLTGVVAQPTQNWNLPPLDSYEDIHN
jgi:hypothetical protein